MALAKLQRKLAKSREKETPLSFFDLEEWEKRLAEARNTAVDVLTDTDKAYLEEEAR